jgi:GNAT superfamily N-acetyltransferase
MTENSVLDVHRESPGRTGTDAPILAGQVTIMPAARASPADLAAILGASRAPAAATGLVAYVDGAPAGWIVVQPRTAGPKPGAAGIRLPARHEDAGDDFVWAVTSLTVRAGYRGRGLTYHLAKATIAYARDRGAQVIEADPVRMPPDPGSAWGELHVCARQVFADAGFSRAAGPSSMLRVDFRHATAGVSAETPAVVARR